ncbi:MAG: FtsX-like permease family protein [Patescibacteria group bacterium]
MRIEIIFKIAFKNLWQNKLRTFLTVSGVTVGIASIVFLVSIGYGLERLVTGQVANFNAFTVVDIPSANLKDFGLNDDSVNRVRELGHISKIAPSISLAGRIKQGAGESATETVIIGGGSDYWELAEIYVEKGNLPSSEKEAVVNRSLLSLIGETSDSIIGQVINLDIIVPRELQAKGAAEAKNIEDVEVRVVGVHRDERSPVVITALSLIKNGGAEKYSNLKIKIDNKDSVSGVRKQLENIGFATEYVGDTVKEIAQVFSLFRAVLAAFGLIALIVAALGTFNTLTISLLERIREIGLFKALGMRNRDVYKLFMAESLIIGISGGAYGMIIGEGLGVAINFSLALLAKRAGAEQVTIFITPWFFAVGIALFSLVIGFLTGWYPAKRAVKLNPLDALRYE